MSPASNSFKALLPPAAHRWVWVPCHHLLLPQFYHRHLTVLLHDLWDGPASLEYTIVILLSRGDKLGLKKIKIKKNHHQLITYLRTTHKEATSSQSTRIQQQLSSSTFSKQFLYYLLSSKQSLNAFQPRLQTWYPFAVQQQQGIKLPSYNAFFLLCACFP